MWLHCQFIEMLQLEDQPGDEWSKLLGLTLPDFREKKTSEPRDKVFALRKLCSAAFCAIKVDYDRPMEDLFTEATRCLIVATQNLETLYTA